MKSRLGFGGGFFCFLFLGFGWVLAGFWGFFLGRRVEEVINKIKKSTVSQSSPNFSLQTALQYLSDTGKLYYPCIRDRKTVLPQVQIDLLQITLKTIRRLHNYPSSVPLPHRLGPNACVCI